MKTMTKMFGPKPKALNLPTSGMGLRLNYELRQVKWHLDPQPPANVVLVHDLLGSTETFSTLIDATAQLPEDGRSPVVSLNYFCVELRHHRRSPSSPEAGLWANVQDIVQFAYGLDPSPSGSHLVGLGSLGGNLAMLAALAKPEFFASLSVINGGSSTNARTEGLLKDLQSIDISKHSLSSFSKVLSEKYPAKEDRFAILQHCAEERNAKGELSLRWKTDLPRLSRVASELLTWPQAVVAREDPHFCNPTCFIDTKARKLTAEEKSLFPNATSLSVSGEWGLKCLRLEDSQKLAPELLTAWGLMGTVEQVLHKQSQMHG